ncbi:MAG: DUF3108 domain-containing protein [Desulfobulbaceae bacterium]|nr:DUF3108 domain-containing protein [Desulfobulbaceae bacterium]
MVLVRILILLCIVCQPIGVVAAEGEKIVYPLGVIKLELSGIGYPEFELLHYDVSWSGGIKIGELHLEVKRLSGVENGHEIRALVTTKGGAVNLFYPINDLHVTKVKGAKKLPYHYEIWQEEGYSYRAHRLLEYDQVKWIVTYLKNDTLEGEYSLEGETNNEFSSFFNSRLMEFKLGQPFTVPTFADKKRTEVAVYPIEKKIIKGTIIGDVFTTAIMPIMKFKGLYEKKGDTVIWYTDDECRVPVKINSKIAIGSLTATLREYKNPACKLYPNHYKRKSVTEQKQEESIK